MAGSSAVKAQVEPAALGLDCVPLRQNALVTLGLIDLAEPHRHLDSEVKNNVVSGLIGVGAARV